MNSYAISNSKLNHKYLCIKQQRSTLLPVVHVVMHIFSNSHLVLKREKTRQKCSASGKKKVCNGRQATFSSILHINFLLQIKNKPNRKKIAMITLCLSYTYFGCLGHVTLCHCHGKLFQTSKYIRILILPKRTDILTIVVPPEVYAYFYERDNPSSGAQLSVYSMTAFSTFLIYFSTISQAWVPKHNSLQTYLPLHHSPSWFTGFAVSDLGF